MLLHAGDSPTRSGIAKKNVDPAPTSLSTQMRPPCISTNFLRDAEAEPRAAELSRDRRVDLPELGEDLSICVGGNADPRIG